MYKKNVIKNKVRIPLKVTYTYRLDSDIYADVKSYILQ